VAEFGAKAARLLQAAKTGLPVLPSYVLAADSPEASAAMRTGRGAYRRGGSGTARRAVLSTPLGEGLEARLRAVVTRLGGRVIVRSSSPLESDPRWSGAFSSLAEIGPDDIGVAVRSCWASAFAVDPLERLQHCGLDVDQLEMAVLIQPEIVPDTSGIARLERGTVHVSGVRGNAAALLTGWVDGDALDRRTVTAVRELACRVHQALGHDTIEWARIGDHVILLQCSRSTAVRPHHVEGTAGGCRVAGTVCVAGDAAGTLRFVRPHEPAPTVSEHILVCERPVPALAPLLFGARGLVSLGGPTDSHLAQVARSLGVPMLVRTPVDRITGPIDQLNDTAGWIAAIDGSRGELAVEPGA
jgi:phosphoenolpyruvate synthase/pyruvate phosphate dikinase